MKTKKGIKLVYYRNFLEVENNDDQRIFPVVAIDAIVKEDKYLTESTEIAKTDNEHNDRVKIIALIEAGEIFYTKYAKYWTEEV